MQGITIQKIILKVPGYDYLSKNNSFVFNPHSTISCQVFYNSDAPSVTHIKNKQIIVCTNTINNFRFINHT